MGLTSHLSDAYDAFSSYCVFSLILIPMKMFLTNMTMKVLGPGSPLVRAFLHVFELSVDCASGLFCKVVIKSVYCVSGIFSVSRSKISLVSISEFLI